MMGGRERAVDRRRTIIKVYLVGQRHAGVAARSERMFSGHWTYSRAINGRWNSIEHEHMDVDLSMCGAVTDWLTDGRTGYCDAAAFADPCRGRCIRGHAYLRAS